MQIELQGGAMIPRGRLERFHHVVCRQVLGIGFHPIVDGIFGDIGESCVKQRFIHETIPDFVWKKNAALGSFG